MIDINSIAPDLCMRELAVIPYDSFKDKVVIGVGYARVRFVSPWESLFGLFALN
jgi:hypothetical protein